MRLHDDRDLAARLARALDGEPSGETEVAALAAVLEHATAPARLRIPDTEVERVLERVRPRARGGERRPSRRLVFAFGAAAAAAAAVLAVTFLQLPGVDVEGKALAALDRGGDLLLVDEHIAPVRRGAFRPSDRLTWLDARTGRVYSMQLVNNSPVEITLVEPGRVVRYQPSRSAAVTGPSCAVLEGGCLSSIDPVAFYRRALVGPGPVRAQEKTVGGRKVYVLTLPVQRARRAVPIEQRVTVDGKTFLPKVIVWRERTPQGWRDVSRITVRSVSRIPRSDPAAAAAFQLTLPEGTRLVQRVAPGGALRKLSTRTLGLGEAAVVRPPIRWLGRSFDGRPFRGIDEVRWNAGRSYRVRYSGLTVWNYTTVIPPELASGRLAAPEKTLPELGGVARFYGSRSGRLVMELDLGRRSIAVVAPALYKEQLIRVLAGLKPLR